MLGGCICCSICVFFVSNGNILDFYWQLCVNFLRKVLFKSLFSFLLSIVTNHGYFTVGDL